MIMLNPKMKAYPRPLPARVKRMRAKKVASAMASNPKKSYATPPWLMQARGIVHDRMVREGLQPKKYEVAHLDQATGKVHVKPFNDRATAERYLHAHPGGSLTLLVKDRQDRLRSIPYPSKHTGTGAKTYFMGKLFASNKPKFSRTRIASPKEYDPKSFRTITPGSGRHKMVVGCPKGKYRGGKCGVGMEVQSVLTAENYVGRKCALCGKRLTRRTAGGYGLAGPAGKTIRIPYCEVCGTTRLKEVDRLIDRIAGKYEKNPKWTEEEFDPPGGIVLSYFPVNQAWGFVWGHGNLFDIRGKHLFASKKAAVAAAAAAGLKVSPKGYLNNPSAKYHMKEAEKEQEVLREAGSRASPEFAHYHVGRKHAHEDSASEALARKWKQPSSNPVRYRNDEERRLWVLNDEGLYRWWKSEGGEVRAFIKEHRAEIDEAIDRALKPREKTWRDYANNPVLASRKRGSKLEYRTINVRTLRGLKEAERLHAQGWKQGSVGLDTIQFYRKNPAGGESWRRAFSRAYAELVENRFDAGLDLKKVFSEAEKARGQGLAAKQAATTIYRSGIGRTAKNPGRGTRNDSEREQWVNNDEGLYNWWKSEGGEVRAFIKEHRAEIDEAIDRALKPREKTWRDYANNPVLASRKRGSKLEYRTINVRTLRGLKEAERLKAQGWKIGSVGFESIQFYKRNPGGYVLEWWQGPAGTTVSKRISNDKELLARLTELREVGLRYTLYDASGNVLEKYAGTKVNPDSRYDKPGLSRGEAQREEKAEMKQYEDWEFPPPPVPTGRWTHRDWVNYIRWHGKPPTHRNPGPAYHKREAKRYSKLLKGDLKVGHKDAAEYWQGALSAEAASVAAGKVVRNSPLMEKAKAKLKQHAGHATKALREKLAQEIKGNPLLMVVPNRELSVPEQHQLKIALSTLRMTPAMAGVMGGMSYDEAKKFLKSVGYTDAQITKLAKNPGKNWHIRERRHFVKVARESQGEDKAHFEGMARAHKHSIEAVKAGIQNNPVRPWYAECRKCGFATPRSPKTTAQQLGPCPRCGVAAWKFGSRLADAATYRPVQKKHGRVYGEKMAKALGKPTTRRNPGVVLNRGDDMQSLMKDPRFAKAVALYRKFHGCDPKSISRRLIPVGGKQVNGREFFVSLGKAPSESYVPPRRSQKAGNIYVHPYESKPEKVVSADGKTIITLPGSHKVTDWIRG